MNERVRIIQEHIVVGEDQDIFSYGVMKSILIPNAVNKTPHALLSIHDTVVSVLRN